MVGCMNDAIIRAMKLCQTVWPPKQNSWLLHWLELRSWWIINQERSFISLSQQKSKSFWTSWSWVALNLVDMRFLHCFHLFHHSLLCLIAGGRY